MHAKSSLNECSPGIHGIHPWVNILFLFLPTCRSSVRSLVCQQTFSGVPAKNSLYWTRVLSDLAVLGSQAGGNVAAVPGLKARAWDLLAAEAGVRHAGEFLERASSNITFFLRRGTHLQNFAAKENFGNCTLRLHVYDSNGRPPATASINLKELKDGCPACNRARAAEEMRVLGRRFQDYAVTVQSLQTSACAVASSSSSSSSSSLSTDDDDIGTRRLRVAPMAAEKNRRRRQKRIRKRKANVVRSKGKPVSWKTQGSRNHGFSHYYYALNHREPKVLLRGHASGGGDFAYMASYRRALQSHPDPLQLLHEWPDRHSMHVRFQRKFGGGMLWAERLFKEQQENEEKKEQEKEQEEEEEEKEEEKKKEEEKEEEASLFV
eukprot:GHVU01113035.1.p1 GENE.GHVU01113035.1~~GHVU01113035.1.p1  ORF type:complete len:378 (+),score=83.57 GHVU01113035.1:1911-3044(+)